MGKGIGPNALGAAKGVGKMYNSVAKQAKEGKKEESSYKPTSIAGFGGPRYIANKIGEGIDAVKQAFSDADDYIGGQMNKAGTADLNAQRKKSAKAVGKNYKKGYYGK